MKRPPISLLILPLFVLFVSLSSSCDDDGITRPRGGGSASEWTPEMTGNAHYGIWSDGADNVFVTGYGGQIFHYDGSGWTVQNVGEARSILSIWGTSVDHVFAGGADGALYHFDGSRWQVMTSSSGGSFHGIAGSGPDNVYAVGDDGEIRRFQGLYWLPLSSPPATDADFRDLWLSPEGTWWACGWKVGESVVVNEGSSGIWTIHTVPSSGALYGIWGTSDADVYVVSSQGKVLHFDGADWTEIAAPTSTLRAIWGTGGNDIWVAGAEYDASISGEWGRIYHYDGMTWTKQDVESNGALVSIRGNSASDIYAGADEGQVFHYDGTGWTEIMPGTEGGIMWGVSGTGEDDVWAVGMRSIYHRDAGGWSTVDRNMTWMGSPARLRDVHAFNRDDAYIVGRAGLVLHYDGVDWAPVNTGFDVDCEAVWASSPDNIYVAGFGGVLHFDGSQWELLDPDPDTRFYTGLGGSSADDVWVLSNKLWHFDGTDWSPVQEYRYRAVWAAARDAVFLADRFPGKIFFYDGTTIAPMEVPEFGAIDALWGRTVDDVYAAGSNLLHYDGESWTVMNYDGDVATWDIWGAPSGAMWAVGGSGDILRLER